jgi:HD domain
MAEVRNVCPGYGPQMMLEEWAAAEAERLLSPLGDRWDHVRAVGECAGEVGAILDQEDRPYLVAAAYLHDIGYAPGLQRTGLHQLDGAYYVRSRGAERLARLIAHHSEARFEIRLRGFATELAAYEREQSWVSDALTYCDLTTGPTGLPMTFEDRVAEVEQRYGEGEIVDALRQATPYLVGAVERTKDRLRQHGLLTRSGDDRLRAALEVVPDPQAD